MGSICFFIVDKYDRRKAFFIIGYYYWRIKGVNNERKG